MLEWDRCICVKAQALKLFVKKFGRPVEKEKKYNAGAVAHAHTYRNTNTQKPKKLCMEEKKTFLHEINENLNKA